MTTPSVNPIISVRKIFQSDTSGSLINPVTAYFETLLDAFVLPAVGGTVSIRVTDSTKYGLGQFIWISTIGWLEIIGITDSTHITLENKGAQDNVDAGASVPAGTVYCTSSPVYPPVDAPFNLTDTLADAFVVPSGLNDGFIIVNHGSWYKVGMTVFVIGAGYFTIQSYNSTTNTLTVKNTWSYNIASGTTIAVTTPIFPAHCPEKSPTSTPVMMRGVRAGVLTSNANDQKVATITLTGFVPGPSVIMLTVKSDVAVAALYGVAFYVRDIVVGSTDTTFDLYYSANNATTVSVQWLAIA